MVSGSLANQKILLFFLFQPQNPHQMKRWFLLLFVILISTNVQAQYEGWIERKFNKPVSELTELEWQQAWRSANNQKGVGYVLIGAGAGALAVGAIFAVAADGWQESDLTGPLLGITALSLGVGIPLLITGNKYQKYVEGFTDYRRPTRKLRWWHFVSLEPAAIYSIEPGKLTPGLSIRYAF